MYATLPTTRHGGFQISRKFSSSSKKTFKKRLWIWSAKEQLSFHFICLYLYSFLFHFFEQRRNTPVSPEITNKAHFFPEKNYFLAEGIGKEKPDINCTDNDGDTPLINAARTGHRDIVKFLLEVHADATIMNKKGTLHRNCANRSRSTVCCCLFVTLASGMEVSDHGYQIEVLNRQCIWLLNLPSF